jgi:hypothetical protein
LVAPGQHLARFGQKAQREWQTERVGQYVVESGFEGAHDLSAALKMIESLAAESEQGPISGTE